MTLPLKVTPIDGELCRFYVDSAVEGRDPYLVDTLRGECGCLHFQCRLKGSHELCKHLCAAREFELDQHHERLLEAHLVSANDGI
jgi:hypothetical protein